jgi:hypothetical protein
LFFFDKPLVFDVTIPNAAKNVAGSIQFVKFLLSGQGKQLFENDGFKLLPLVVGGNKTAIPQEVILSSILTWIAIVMLVKSLFRQIRGR